MTMASFSSPVVFGLLVYTRSLRKPHKKKSRGLRSGEWGAHWIAVLTLFRAGSERFDSGRGAFRPPVRSQKPSIGATSGKRCWIGLSMIYNFYIKRFRVRSILRSPEVIKYKMSKKMFEIVTYITFELREIET